MSHRAIARLIVAAAALLVLGGCAYDYLAHTDRIAYSAGNAVKANLERETTNPSRKSMKSKDGLGKDGAQVPASSSGGTGASAGN